MDDPQLLRTTYAGQPYVEHTFSSGVLKDKTLNLPKGIAEDLEDISKAWASNDEVMAILRPLDYITNSFKIAVTSIWPAFNVRNAYSNVAASFVDIQLQAMNPAKHGRALKVMTGADGTFVAKNGRRYTYEQLRSLAKSNGIMPSSTRVAELTGKARSLEDDIVGVRQVASAGRTFAQGIENEAKMVHFLALLDRGYSHVEAIEQVKKFVFDYADLSPFEKNVMRRLFPFYTWTRKNIERQAKNLLERPGLVAAQIKPFTIAETGPEADMLPDYVRGDLKVKLAQRPGKAGAYITNIDLPINNVNMLWAGGLGRTFREHINMINPFLKMPLELAMNQDTFTGKTIRGRAWMGRMGPTMDRLLPGKLKDWLEMEKIELTNGSTVYKANGTKLYLTLKGMFLGRLTSTSVDVDELIRELSDDGTAFGAMKVLAGMRFDEFDLDEAEMSRIRNVTERLEAKLLEEGSVSKFERVFRPQAEQESATGRGIFGGSRLLGTR